jgi:hypothetical protein
MPVYRYKFLGLDERDLQRRVQGGSILDGIGPGVFVDVEVPTQFLDDLNDYMSSVGYAYDSTDPTNTPEERAISEIAVGTVAAVQARRTTTLGITTGWVTISFDTKDIETQSSVVDYDGATSSARIFQSGVYLVHYSSTYTNTTSGTVYAHCLKNGVEVLPGSERQDFIYQNEGDNLMGFFVVSLNPGDSISVQHQATTNNMTMVAGSMLNVQRLTGMQGATGSGSSISIQNNGTPIVDTPHSSLNFTGGITAVNVGSGLAKIEPVFGALSQYVFSNTLGSQTGTTLATYLTLTTPSIPAGLYRVSMAITWSHSSTSTNFIAQLVQDGTTLWDFVQEPQDSNIAQRHSASCFSHVSCSAGVHTFSITFRASAAGATARVHQGAIEFWRVS